MHYRYLLVSLLFIASSCQPATKRAPALRAPTGIYVGLDEMKSYPAENPGDRWYHENIVYIRPDSLFLEGNPVVVHRNGEKGYSASDGGFYSFNGRIDTLNGQLTARLHMFAHDYLMEPIIIKDTVAAKKLGIEEALKRGLAVRDSSMYYRTYPIHLTPTGFEMNSVRYTPFKPDSTFALLGFPDPKSFFSKRR